MDSNCYCIANLTEFGSARRPGVTTDQKANDGFLVTSVNFSPSDKPGSKLITMKWSRHSVLKSVVIAMSRSRTASSSANFPSAGYALALSCIGQRALACRSIRAQEYLRRAGCSGQLA